MTANLRVLLSTNRLKLRAAWELACDQLGVFLRTADPADVLAHVRDHDALVIDGDCQAYDEDEMLLAAAMARSCGLQAAVIATELHKLQINGDLLAELTGGLLLQRPHQPAEILAALIRRCDARRAARFEYVSISPIGPEIVVVRGSGEAELLTRPVSRDDDGSDVVDIAIDAAAGSAVLSLASGKQVRLQATNATSAAVSPPTLNASEAVAGIDGAALGPRLKALRLRKGLTQAEVARRSGIHRPNIARVEAGRHTPSLDTLQRLAEAIGVATADILIEAD